MYVATVIVTALLATVLTASAALKLSHTPAVIEFYGKVGVPADKLNYLAALLLAAAAGLVTGLLWPPIGVAAASGVVLYFAAAIGFHLRARDLKGLPNPMLLLVLAAAALVLRLLT